jgi:transcriptional regulator with XRE-family HTH domain
LDPAIAFGLVLRTVRKAARLTQEQVALAADVERNFVSLMERGINQPTVRVIFKLARALEISPSALMNLVEQEVAAHADRDE